MADSRPAVVEQPTERAEAFLRLADEHLDAAYRLARAILRDADRARRTPHTTRSSRLGASGRRSETRRASSPGSTGSSSTPVATGCDPLVGNRPTSRPRSRSRSGDPYGQAHDRELLADAIAGLSPDHRVVVALRYYRDLPVEEIASRLGIPAGTVQSRLHYALKRLHASIGTADGKGTIR